MFRIVDNAIAPKKAHFERALKRLPVAHRLAQHAGVTHLHGEATSALEKEGLDPSPVGVFWKKGTPYLGIEYGEDGDRLSDVEYGPPRCSQPDHPVGRPKGPSIGPEDLWGCSEE